jgi:hypothetical protein
MTRNAQLNLRVRPALKAKLEKLAKQDRRTLSAYVENLPEDHIAAFRATKAKVLMKRPHNNPPHAPITSAGA